MPGACDSVNHFCKIVTTISGRSPQVCTCIFFADVFRFCFDFFCFYYTIKWKQTSICAVRVLLVQISWKCDHCDKVVFKGQFRAGVARVHLAAESSNGICANLCTTADDSDEGIARRKKYRAKIKELQDKKDEDKRKRLQQNRRLLKREAEVIVLSQKKKQRKTQPKLKVFLREQDNAAADVAVSQWALAHDIAPHAMQGPYWKMMNKKLASVGGTYTPMYPRKMYEKMLSALKKMAKVEVAKHLKHRPSVGRTVTGDAATKKVPLLNFLAHVPGKGVKLVQIHDCSEHMEAGGTKDAM